MVVRSALANGMDWTDLDALVQAETANGNPVASLIHELRLDRNQARSSEKNVVCIFFGRGGRFQQFLLFSFRRGVPWIEALLKWYTIYGSCYSALLKHTLIRLVRGQEKENVMYLRPFVYRAMCVCLTEELLNLHINAQFGPVMLVILCPTRIGPPKGCHC